MANAKATIVDAARKARSKRRRPSAPEDTALYVVLPAEIPSFRQIQTLADESLLSTTPLWARCEIYLQLQPNISGVDGVLRELLFPSKQCKRGFKAPPVDTSSGKRPRGRPRKGAAQSENEKQAAHMARVNSNRIIQRHSKQRGRCESRLVALIFSVMYDISINESPLTEGIPLLREEIRDNDGNVIRTRSNYTTVRAFLRQSMMTIISVQCEAIRILADMAFSEMNHLPSTTVSVARTFTALYVLRQEPSSLVQDGNAVAPAESGEKMDAFKLVDKCIENICNYGQDWWRRNYTRNNRMPKAEALKRDHSLMRASETLLNSMIRILTPTDPCDATFRSHFIHGFASGGEICHRAGNCYLCDGSEERTVEDLTEGEDACHAYVGALTSCFDLINNCPRNVRETELSKPHLCGNSPLWKHSYSLALLHRFQAQSTHLRSMTATGASDSYRIYLQRDFLHAIRMHVGRVWVALYASNESSIEMIRKLKLRDEKDLEDNIVNVIFGGTVGMETLLENDEEIIEIASKLLTLSKEGQQDAVEEEDVDSVQDGAVGDSPKPQDTPSATAPSAENSTEQTTVEGDAQRELGTGCEEREVTDGNAVTTSTVQNVRQEPLGAGSAQDHASAGPSSRRTEEQHDDGSRNTSTTRNVGSEDGEQRESEPPEPSLRRKERNLPQQQQRRQSVSGSPANPIPPNTSNGAASRRGRKTKNTSTPTAAPPEESSSAAASSAAASPAAASSAAASPAAASSAAASSAAPARSKRKRVTRSRGPTTNNETGGAQPSDSTGRKAKKRSTRR